MAGKGKSRDTSSAAAISGLDRPNERSPLLGQSGTGYTAGNTSVRHGRGLLSDDDDLDSDGDRADGDVDRLLRPGSGRRGTGIGRHNLRKLVCYTFLFTLSIIFIAFAILHLWLGRFVSEQLRNDGRLLRERGSQALLWEGPDKVQLLNMQSDQVTVKVDMRMGVDVRTALGWNGTTDESKLSFSRRLERKLVGWGTRRMGQATMDLVEPVFVAPASNAEVDMVQIQLSDPITLPLHYPEPKHYDPTDRSWLRPVSFLIPTTVLEPNTLATFINNTLNSKLAKLHLTVKKAHLSLGREEDRSWLTRTVQHYGGQSIEDFKLDQTVEIPDAPQVPSDPGALVELKSYKLDAVPKGTPPSNQTHTPSETLVVHATARVQNPAFEQLRKIGLDINIPFAFPYKLLINPNETEIFKKNRTAKPVLLAQGVVEPFSISSAHEKFDISINATVRQSGNQSSQLSKALSNFVTRFIAGDNNTAMVAFDADSPHAKSLPAFLIPFLEPLMAKNEIPGLPPDERELLKDLQIKDMKIHGSEDGSSSFQIDGLMEGRIVFPQGLDSLDNAINITSVWPDIILYDNMAPANGDGNVPPQPLPLNAFARFRTNDWTPAVTVKLPDNTTVMRAYVKNVPFEILNGSVLQKWIGKIIFSGSKGVRTGVKGISQGRATLRGFGEVELHRLPVLGTFYAQNPYA